MSMFRAGQRVVCVPGPGATGGCLEAIRNKVVTIFAVKRCLHGELVGVHVDGHPTACRECGDHGGEFYRAKHFRPIETQSLTAELAQKESQRLVEERPEYTKEPQTA